MLRARLEAAARELMTPAGWSVDFTLPAGEPALVGPDSVSWKVFANPVTLFVGGVAAVILELAEPRVRAGVWAHSSFQHDPVGRLQRTGLAAMITVYGARSVAEAMIAGINRRHAAVHGRTDGGETYRADDPELLTWVQATAAFGFLEAYATYVRPVDAADRDAYYTEGLAAARLYGATAAPSSEAELRALFGLMEPRLAPSETLTEFLRLMRTAPLLPPALRGLQRLLVRAAVEVIPGRVRQRLHLGEQRLSAWEKPIVAAMARLADRFPLRDAPPAQARRRLDKVRDVYRGRNENTQV